MQRWIHSELQRPNVWLLRAEKLDSLGRMLGLGTAIPKAVVRVKIISMKNLANSQRARTHLMILTIVDVSFIFIYYRCFLKGVAEALWVWGLGSYMMCFYLCNISTKIFFLCYNDLVD